MLKLIEDIMLFSGILWMTWTIFWTVGYLIFHNWKLDFHYFYHREFPIITAGLILVEILLGFAYLITKRWLS